MFGEDIELYGANILRNVNYISITDDIEYPEEQLDSFIHNNFKYTYHRFCIFTHIKQFMNFRLIYIL